jgi:hypothetical protein
MRVAAVACGLLLFVPVVAAAQDGAGPAPRFVTGPLNWSPAIRLSEFGFDSNIFVERRGREVEDIIGTLSPSVAATIDRPTLTFNSTATVDMVYFERYADQRALNQRYAARAEVKLTRFQPFGAGRWERVRDRQSPEVDLRARRIEREATVGVNVFSVNRTSLRFSVRHGALAYEDGQLFQGVDLASQLNRSSTAFSGGVQFAATPFTSLTLDVSNQRDDYALAPQKNQSSNRVMFAVNFTPDAVIRGSAAVGVSHLGVEDPMAIPYTGLTTNIDLSYTLLGVTRFGGRVNRETAASVQEPYYLQTTFGADVQQAFFGPVDLVFRLTHQLLEYEGIPVRNMPGHTDTLNIYAFGAVFRLSDTASVDTTFELGRRDSTTPELRYDRQRLITSVLLGF